MTLVLSCITPKFVLQVSDRRLTYPNGSVADDETNKAVVFQGHILFGYTGLARIARTDTHVWTVEALLRGQASTAGNFMASADHLGKEATRAFQRIPDRGLKRHAFVAAGWASSGPGSQALRPFLMTISNALDDTGRWLPLADRHFRIAFHSLPEGELFSFFSIGQALTSDEDVSIRRNLRRCLVRGA